ncbi:MULTISPECIES: cobalamin B12-binding domain-containing protein [Nocardia]|uniref:Cobalamin-binding protein n=2 Tax=Nocardia TaxID=1817 RepID=A0A2T2ZBR4_9NOCA|nr:MULTISPECIES: cobalamin-dependent protein [Nocardia]MBF6447641.1 cobalamin-dependent protein [Nocardia elegans]PSR65201.1 cobalamin-binding protein [Nocardia nova]
MSEPHRRNSRDAPAFREQLWTAVTGRDERAAIGIVLAAVDSGLEPEAVLLDVIAAVQRRVGAEWAANTLSVADEHTATAINDRAVTALALHASASHPASAGRVTVACVDGEWHALPARLVTEVLRLRGWQVDFLGAQVPTRHLIAHLHNTGPDAVLLSSSLPTRLPSAHGTITACQAAGVPVLVGGAAFGPDGRYANLLGADAWAPDAATAAELLARRLRREQRPPDRPHRTLPHLTDQEFTMIARSTPQLLATTMAELEHHFPAMREYSESQLERTAEDIAQILEFLATALYLDDDELFTTFVTWTAGVLSARAVPAQSLFPVLDLLSGQLQDFPRARRILTAATDALTGTARIA